MPQRHKAGEIRRPGETRGVNLARTLRERLENAHYVGILADSKLQ